MTVFGNQHSEFVETPRDWLGEVIPWQAIWLYGRFLLSDLYIIKTIELIFRPAGMTQLFRVSSSAKLS